MRSEACSKNRFDATPGIGIGFIQRAKRLGFSLKEITDLLTLRVDGNTSCEQVKAATFTKLEQVERKLIELERIRQALQQVASLCTGEGPASACPMLDALDQQEPLEQLAEDRESKN
jgi:MerR family mercuric resistance operon transcriptional regulator